MNKFTSAIMTILLSLIIPVFAIIKEIEFQQNCAGYLKQAADANTIDLALDRISKALDYMEKNNLTSGYTSILWQTEDENVGYWYKNVVACKEELLIGINSSQLEKTNILMNVRESLTDIGKKGVKLTIPKGISRYPNNGAWALLLVAILCIFLLGEVLLIEAFENITW